MNITHGVKKVAAMAALLPMLVSGAVKDGVIKFTAPNQNHIVWGREVCTEGIIEPTGRTWNHGIRADKDPATLVLAFKKSGTFVCTCFFNKDLTLVWNPENADTEFVLSNRVCSTTGELHVSNGTFRVTKEAGFPFLRRIVVGPNGRLVIDPSAALVFTDKLEVAPGGKLEVTDPTKLDVFSGEKAQLEPKEKWAEGPVANAEDQFRCFYYIQDRQYERARDLGMNTMITKDEMFNEVVHRKLVRDGIGYMLYNEIHDKEMYEKYPRVYRDGRKQDAYDFLGTDLMDKWRERLGKMLPIAASKPTAIGFHVASEMCNRVAPCWSDAHKAAWKEFSGKEWPESVILWDGRPGVQWTKLKDLPADRLIDDDYTPYQFYRWFWHDDLYYRNYMDMAVDMTTKAFGRKTITMFDPCIRFPPLWAPMGKVTHVNEWQSCMPIPFLHSYIVSKQKAMARGAGQKVMTMVQGIFSRGDCAPKKMPIPPNAPEWARVYTNGVHVVPPCDMMREAFWSVFARQLDGICVYGNWTMFATEAYGVPRDSSGCWEPNTEPMIRDLFARVAIPLGPLFKAAPEREPEVAILETLPSALLSGRAPYDWKIGMDVMRSGIVATGANLAPYTLYDDEILRDGIPPSIKVILAPEAGVLTKRVAAKLKAFQARGGKILARDDFAPGMKRDGALPHTLMEDRPNTEFGTTSCNNPNFSGQEYDDDLRQAQRNFRAAIKGVLPQWKPFADTDNVYLQAYSRRAGKADLLFVQNSKRGLGWYMGPWKRVLDKGLPNQGKAWLEREAGAVYDLVAHRPVKFTVKNGRTEVNVAYKTTEGNVFLVTSKPLKPLKLKVSKVGEGVAVNVSGVEKDVMRPFGVIVDGQKPFYAILKNGNWSRVFDRGSKVELIDLATGKE